jgi:phage repressor protein C with HTH and peptisase S24 domain
MADSIGVSLNTWGRYESGERKPDADAFRRLAELGWNPAWILTGEGDPKLSTTMTAVVRQVRKDEAAAAAAHDEGKEDVAFQAMTSDFCFVPYMSVRVAAGAGQVVESEQIVAWMAFRKSYLQTLGVPSKAACLVRVKGDSMEPDLRDGDTVLLDTSDTRISDRPHAFAFRIDGGDEIAVKRIRRTASCLEVTGGDHWPATTFAEEPAVIGRVRWSGRTWD